jgi:hypothetical protein
MNTTTESPDVSSAEVRRRRRHAIGMIVGGSAAVALFALFGTAWPEAPETTVASASVQLVDQATAPLRVQDVDDSDDEAQQAENNAIQSMIQSEQQAQEQNDQAEQQFTQDQLQAQQDEQQANQ